MPEVLFMKAELVYLHFSVCHVVSRLVPPFFSLANSLMLSASLERYKNTFSKVNCNKNILETENSFLREESIVQKKKNDNKKIKVGDL